MTTLEGVNPQMIANNLKPFLPTHPGEVLKDELEYRGISQRGLAKEIGISYSAFNEMLNGKRLLSPELAMMMEAALGVDAAPLLAMQNEYDMLMAERDESFMEKLKHIRRIAAIFWDLRMKVLFKSLRKQESKNLESLFLNRFYQKYRALPVGNAARSYEISK